MEKTYPWVYFEVINWDNYTTTEGTYKSTNWTQKATTYNHRFAVGHGSSRAGLTNSIGVQHQPTSIGFFHVVSPISADWDQLETRVCDWI